MFPAILIAAYFILVTFSSYAQNQDVFDISEDSIILGEPISPLDNQAQTDSVWVVLQMVLVLALVALAIYGIVFFIKRLSRPKQIIDPNLKILASVPLSADTFASVISVGSKAWLVGGGTGAGVSLISEIDEPEALETMLLEDARKTAEANTNRVLDFKSLLNRFGKNPEAQSMDSHAESIRRQRDRLKGLGQ